MGIWPLLIEPPSMSQKTKSENVLKYASFSPKASKKSLMIVKKKLVS